MAEASDRTYQRQLSELGATHDVVIVDFWADWCAPCKQLTPKLHKLVDETPTAALLTFEAGTDKHPSTAVPAEYGITNLPVVLVFRRGELVADLRGDSQRILRGAKEQLG